MPDDEGAPWPSVHEGTGGEHVFFLHGFLGCKEDWLPIIGRLAGTCRCHAVDLPGHGALPGPVPSWKDMAGALDAQRVRAGIQRCHVVGYSMGGRLALRWALDRPDAIASLTLVSASPGIEEPRARNRRVEADREVAQRLATRPPRMFLEEWYRQDVFHSLLERPELARTLVVRRAGFRPADMVAVLEQWGQGVVPAAWQELASMPIPLLAVAGALDPTYCRHLERMRNLSPRIRGVIVQGAGHAVPEEEPEALADAIREFISNRNEP